MEIKAINIKWDDDEAWELEDLPKEIEIPEYVDFDDDDAISDFLSDSTGYCHTGFDIVE